MLRNWTAEALGTAFLMAVVVGSTLMSSRMTPDPAIGLLATSLVVGGGLFIAITLFGPVSGGHLNPAVTLMAMLQGQITGPVALGYGAAQLVGAIAGTALASVMFGLPAFQIAATVRDTPSLWLSEFIATAGLIMVILGGTAARGAVPVLVGVYVTAGYWFTASTGFSNPAMTVARTLTDTAAGLRPTDLPAYLVAQITGALAGYTLGTWLFAKEKPPSLADGG